MTTLNATEAAPLAPRHTSPYLDLLEQLRTDVAERVEWLTVHEGTSFDEIDKTDLAWEAADACVPIYTHELAALCADVPALLTDEPDCGPAAEHYGPGLRWVVANLFERLSDEALDHLHELEEAAS